MKNGADPFEIAHRCGLIETQFLAEGSARFLGRGRAENRFAEVSGQH